MLFGGFACTPDNGEEGDNSYAELTVTPASISATLEGATETLVVTSNATWVATCDQTDVVLSTIAGYQVRGKQDGVGSRCNSSFYS